MSRRGVEVTFDCLVHLVPVFVCYIWFTCLFCYLRVGEQVSGRVDASRNAGAAGGIGDLDWWRSVRRKMSQTARENVTEDLACEGIVLVFVWFLIAVED